MAGLLWPAAGIHAGASGCAAAAAASSWRLVGQAPQQPT
jgi:hypothetical protein